jgi:hypothetical protein
MGKFVITQTPAAKDIYLYPENNGCVNECFAFGDIPNFECVNDEQDVLEPETDYVFIDGVSSVSEQYAMGNHGTITGNINYVKAYCKAKSDKYPPHINANYKVAINKGLTMSFTTLTLRPNADGAFTQWIALGGGVHYDEVYEAICDNYTTTIREATNGDKDYFHLPNHTTEIGTITKVEVFACCGNGDAGVKLVIYDTSSTNRQTFSVSWIVADGWNMKSHVFATNPDGGAWTWADIDDLQIGVEKESGGMPYISQMYVEVTYESGYTCGEFALSENMPLCTGYGLFSKAWLESPWTSTTWIWDEIDATQVGFECSSPSVVMSPFAVLPTANGDRTDITNVTTGYEHWEAVEKEKPYAEVFESGAAWKYDLYKFIQQGTDYYPTGVGSDERAFFPFEYKNKNYALLTGSSTGIWIYEWTGDYLRYITKAVTAEPAICVTFDGTYFYVGGSDAVDGLIMAYTFDGEILTNVGTYHAGTNNPTNININGSIENNDGYIYFVGANNLLEALSFNGDIFTQKGSINSNGGFYLHCDGTYIHTGKHAYSFNGTSFTDICAGGDDVILGNDSTYLYATDAASIKAYTFDGSAYMLIASIATGGTSVQFLCCSRPVPDEYIYACVNTGGTAADLKAYTFDGINFTEEGSQSFSWRKDYIYASNKFIYTCEYSVTSDARSGWVHSFNGSEFKTLAKVENGSTPKYLTDDILSVTVVAKMGKDLSAPDQADIRGCFNIKTHATEYNTSANYFTLESIQRYYAHTWTVNPNTSVAWTLAEVRALQAGIGLYGTGSKYAICSRCYIVISASTEVSPEIHTCQTYMKVNYTPDASTCSLSRPEEISTNHSRNIKMLNFWNGTREVYDVNRSGKSMVLTGGEVYTGSCDTILCIRNMARDGNIITISGLNPVYFNGDYRINSFGWNKISEKPERYKWILELESAN